MSGVGASGPGPDGRHDDLTPEDLAGLSLHIPDDPRELLAERAPRVAPDDRQPVPATRSRADHRKARRRRLTLTAAVVAISMLVVALSGAVGAWIVGPQASAPPAVPLANVLPDPGQVGGLLPDAALQDGGATIPARALRPAVIVVVPPACDECAELLTTLAPQVASFGYSMVAVGAPGQEQQLTALAETVGTTRLATLVDQQGTLRAAYGLTGSTIVLVRNDGVVVDVVRDPTPETRIEGALVSMAPAAGQRA
ncbi:MAG: hypothetical protein ABI474_07275 [Actinomycetota bacterium]